MSIRPRACFDFFASSRRALSRADSSSGRTRFHSDARGTLLRSGRTVRMAGWLAGGASDGAERAESWLAGQAVWSKPMATGDNIMRETVERTRGK